jgi:hypothetical protein
VAARCRGAGAGGCGTRQIPALEMRAACTAWGQGGE